MVSPVRKLLLLLALASPCAAQPDPYASIYPSTAAGIAFANLSGIYGFAASTQTYQIFTATVDGTTGNSSFSGTVTSSGVNATTDYYANGTPGASISCPSGSYLSTGTVVNGIVTGGVCAVIGSFGNAGNGWTRQVFTSGKGVYYSTTSTGASPIEIRVTVIGGGGGGGDSEDPANTLGFTANPSVFGSTSVPGGGGGASSSSSDPGYGGYGGVGGAGYPPSNNLFWVPGGGGGAGGDLLKVSGSPINALGGTGGNSIFGGGGYGPSFGPGGVIGSVASPGATNTGGGGSGAGTTSGPSGGSGGGGAGSAALIVIPNPAANYSFSVSSGGIGYPNTFCGGNCQGGNGASGVIIVDEMYPNVTPPGLTGPAGPTGPAGAGNFTGPAQPYFILFSTSQNTYADLSQNTDGTVSVTTTSVPASAFTVIANANTVEWVTASSYSGVLWKAGAPANSTFTVTGMAMYDANGVLWSFTADPDGVFRTTKMGQTGGF